MAILLIVFQILSALPTIIKVISSIIALIHSVPKNEGRGIFKARLSDILSNIKEAGKFTAEHGAQLEQLYNDVKKASAL